jgi:excisionase family DNA binding protein
MSEHENGSEARRLLTIAEFARLYSVSIPTIYRLVGRGELRLVKIGRASRIPREDAEAWAAGLTTGKVA